MAGSQMPEQVSPDISIVMAIRNSEAYLAEALTSIAAQNYPAYELIAVDGGSTDAGPAMVRSFPNASCIPQTGTGFANAWNTGIKASRAPLIAFLDSDDLWGADKTVRQLALLRANPAAGAVYGRVSFFLQPGHQLPPGYRPELLEESRLTPMTGSTILRREIVERLGEFDENLTIASDIAWFAKLRDKISLVALDEVVLFKRLHASNLGHITPQSVLKTELLTLLKERITDSRSLPKGRG